MKQRFTPISHSGIGGMYEMRCLFVPVVLNALFIVRPNVIGSGPKVVHIRDGN